jgi:hypothetical protein
MATVNLSGGNRDDFEDENNIHLASGSDHGTFIFISLFYQLT